MFTVALAGKKKFAVQDIYVVKDLHQPLLKGQAPEAYDLIKKNCVNAVNSDFHSIFCSHSIICYFILDVLFV